MHYSPATLRFLIHKEARGAHPGHQEPTRRNRATQPPSRAQRSTTRGHERWGSEGTDSISSSSSSNSDSEGNGQRATATVDKLAWRRSSPESSARCKQQQPQMQMQMQMLLVRRPPPLLAFSPRPPSRPRAEACIQQANLESRTTACIGRVPSAPLERVAGGSD